MKLWLLLSTLALSFEITLLASIENGSREIFKTVYRILNIFYRGKYTYFISFGSLQFIPKEAEINENFQKLCNHYIQFDIQGPWSTLVHQTIRKERVYITNEQSLDQVWYIKAQSRLNFLANSLFSSVWKFRITFLDCRMLFEEKLLTLTFQISFLFPL